MHILGISAFYHDSAACLLKNGEIIAAAQEERFTRIKHDPSYPKHSIAYCLKKEKILPKDLHAIAFYEKPFLKFDRILHSYLTTAPKGIKSFLMAIPLWIRERIWMKTQILEELPGFQGEIYFPEHHESHAASAFYPSPYEEAAILTIDGVGEWTTTSYGLGKTNTLELLAEMKFPHSLGLLYSAFTQLTGFKVNSGEYKLMGLAPYGQPRYTKTILDNLLDLKEDGSFRLNMTYFDYISGTSMISPKLEKLFGRRARKPESPLTQNDMDIASSIQAVTEEILYKMAIHIQSQTGQHNLCLAGGVALNCVANGKILREEVFKNLWIQPAAGDAGGALGAALLTWHQILKNPRTSDNKTDKQKGSCLGPEYSEKEIQDYLEKNQIPFQKIPTEDIPKKTADLIKDGNVIGWFQGRMEFGPRALGARSILGNPLCPTMQETMNLKIKFRESFRPFAPSILEKKCQEWFCLKESSPYMLLVAPINESKKIPTPPEEKNQFGLEKLLTPRSKAPAVTHVDYSARIQTVNQPDSLFHKTLEKLDETYQCPLVINTSFNVRGEPIVCSPEDAYLCFMRTNMDYLLLGNFLLQKTTQKPLPKDINWLKTFELD